ncbi:MAG: Preprotein translocase, SecE subunit [candidate division TM6 bacterium GW2011_GWF2_32_72]|nr:MAG: Preprotein translocase, SecE subunit [candidate division TM6 bacterium GW2011_GWF2_32_72]
MKQIGLIKEAFNFFEEVKVEFSKVTWPKYNEFVGSTLIVLLLVVLFSFYFFAVDSSLSFVMKKVFTSYFG